MLLQTDRQTDRNYGIDLLRIVCMIMIPCLHIMGHGGALESVKIGSANYFIAWLLETICFCAPNCYALITGYVCVKRRIKYKSIISLLLQVYFYTLIITVLVKIIRPDSVGLKDIAQAIVPFAYDTYWYFTGYFVMFFFIPAFNFLMQKMKPGTARKFIFWLILMLSILPTLFHSDFAYTNAGYSALWLSAMYLLGAYVQIYGISPFKNKERRIAILMIVITWGSKITIDLVTNHVLGSPRGGAYLLQYSSPTIVLYSVCMLIVFSRLHFGSELTRIIRIFAPLTFGVYLFSEEPLIRSLFITNKFEWVATLNPISMMGCIIGIAFVIWLLGSVVDWCRNEIFKVLRVKKLSMKIADAIPQKVRF